MARTKASEILSKGSIKPRGIKVHPGTKIKTATKPVINRKHIAQVKTIETAEKKQRAFKWHPGTQAKRRVIKQQKVVDKSLIQYADGVSAVKAIIAKIQERPIDDPRDTRLRPAEKNVPEYINIPFKTGGYYTTAGFKAAAVDVLQHAMVDITRAAQQYQCHRRYKEGSAGRCDKAVKLLMADIRAVGQNPLQSTYNPRIFDVTDEYTL